MENKYVLTEEKFNERYELNYYKKPYTYSYKLYLKHVRVWGNLIKDDNKNYYPIRDAKEEEDEIIEKKTYELQDLIFQ